MGKTQKKARQGETSNQRGFNRLIAAKERQQKQLQLEKKQKHQKAISLTEQVRGMCEKCGQQQTFWVDSRTAKLLGGKIIAHCGQCHGCRLFNVPRCSEQQPRAIKNHILKACRKTGLRFRIENQYVILTGKKVRWYVDYTSIRRSVFYCGKTRRIWGKNTEYELFYSRSSINAVDAILEIGTYDRMIEDVPRPMTEELRGAIRRIRLQEACDRVGFTLSIKEPFACIQTEISEWKYDYHREKVTLLHRDKKPTLDMMTQAVMDFHVQYVGYDYTVEQVIEGIASHDIWRKKEQSTVSV